MSIHVEPGIIINHLLDLYKYLVVKMEVGRIYKVSPKTIHG